MNFALEIAARTGASVKVLHVLYPNEGVDNNVYSAIWIDEYFEQRKKDLTRWVARFKKKEAFKNVPVQEACTFGFPVQNVKDAVEAGHADLVVMGTTGISGWSQSLLGSTAAGVVSAVQIPVMVVPMKADFLARTTYVLATDYEMHPNRHSMQVLREALQVQRSNLHVLHVLNQQGETPEPTKERALGAMLEGIEFEFHYLHDASVAQAISNYVEAIKAGGLVTVSHRKNFLQKIFFQSKSKLLVQQIKVPVLVLHDQ